MSDDDDYLSDSNEAQRLRSGVYLWQFTGTHTHAAVPSRGWEGGVARARAPFIEVAGCPHTHLPHTD